MTDPVNEDVAVVRKRLDAGTGAPHDPTPRRWDAHAALDRLQASLEAAEAQVNEVHQVAAEYEAERDEARADAERLAAALRKTVVRVEGYTGPPVWWHSAAEAALAAHEEGK